MENCDKFRVAMKPYAGKTLSTAKITNVVWNRYPEMPVGSNKPSEHADNTNATQGACAGTPRRVFSRVERGVYSVRSV
jgi:hypothetical protein